MRLAIINTCGRKRPCYNCGNDIAKGQIEYRTQILDPGFLKGDTFSHYRLRGICKTCYVKLLKGDLEELGY